MGDRDCGWTSPSSCSRWARRRWRRSCSACFLRCRARAASWSPARTPAAEAELRTGSSAGCGAVLVIAEVALSIVLLLGAGLLMRSFLNLATVDLRINTRDVATAGCGFRPAIPSRPPNASGSIGPRWIACPRYQASCRRPCRTGAPVFGGMRSIIQVPGGQREDQPSGIVLFCSVAILHHDRAEARRRPVPVIGRRRGADGGSPSSTKRSCGGISAAQNPIGRTVGLPRLAELPVAVTDPTFEVIGVVQDVPNQGIREPASPRAYVPLAFRGPSSLIVLMRTTADPLHVLNTMRRELRALDRQVAIVELLEAPRRSDAARVLRAAAVQPDRPADVRGHGARARRARRRPGVMAYTVSQQRVKSLSAWRSEANRVTSGGWFFERSCSSSAPASASASRRAPRRTGC